jgi:HNH endonuclease
MTAIPHGFCQCGCGRRTNIARDNDRGFRKGEPYAYLAGHYPRTLKQRYVVEDRGYETPCWIWQMAMQDNGYGHFADRSTGYTGTAHRWFYEQEHGPTPPGAQHDHLCRVKACVNPTHLELVTCAENARRGDNAKLTYEDVAEIKRLRATGLFQREVAEQFGVSRGTVSDIDCGRTWVALGGVI